MARERNNMYAVAADAVDLTLDTVGIMGSMVVDLAHKVGIGSPEPKQVQRETEQRQADDAAERVATSLRQEAEQLKPNPQQTPRSEAPVKASSHKANSATTGVKARSEQPKTRTTTRKGRSAPKVAAS